MGTNYYRIPTEREIEEKKQKLQSRIRTMSISADSINDNFRFIEDPKDEWSPLNPWDEFIEDCKVHLGKRSGGWKFCWNFHDEKYYKDKNSLLEFIRKGRVVDEYGVEWDVEEFITMALEWGQPDGQVADAEYFKNYPHPWMSESKEYVDREVDGLRVSSSTQFS